MEDPVPQPDSEGAHALALLLVLGSAELEKLGEREEHGLQENMLGCLGFYSLPKKKRTVLGLLKRT